MEIASQSNNIDTVIPTKEEYQKLISENQKLQSELLYFKQELEKLKHLIFGSKSERFVPTDKNQLSLAIEAEEQTPEVSTEDISYTRHKIQENKQVGHSRMVLPAHLPREEHIIEPEEDVTNCKKIGENITEILEYTPGKLYVKRYVRPKYARPNEEGIVIGELPSLPIPKGNAGPSILAHLFISKFIDHLPFYRQRQQLKRQGMTLAESTINGWLRSSCGLLDPLDNLLKIFLLKEDYLMVDETPIPVLSKDKKGSTHKGYLWVYYSPIRKIVYFDYQHGRGREGPTAFLKDFKGTIQTDGYKAYDIFDTLPDIQLLACMAHVRRKFDEAKSNDKPRAEYMLTQIQQLYKIERQASEEKLTHEQRKQLREEKALPVLNLMEQWLKNEIIQVLPKSSIGQAIAYTLNLWSRLIRYIDDGRFEIDNNLVENSIRPVAIGRKNYMFAGSHEGAKRGAMMYSLLGTCKKNNIEPY
jgi:transposase